MIARCVVPKIELNREDKINFTVLQLGVGEVAGGQSGGLHTSTAHHFEFAVPSPKSFDVSIENLQLLHHLLNRPNRISSCNVAEPIQSNRHYHFHPRTSN